MPHDQADFDKFEEAFFSQKFSVPAADLSGATGALFGEEGRWEGRGLYSLDDLIDRDQLAVMLLAEHHLEVYVTSTETADGTVRAEMEVSTSPAASEAVDLLDSANDVADTAGALPVDADGSGVITSDLVGRALSAVAFGPFSDGATGVGGSGVAGVDWWEGVPVANPVFDDRDDLFVNGVIEASNIADAAIHADLHVRHVYGVVGD